ncbi:hypothetical protein GPECTOR_1g94 [Gonium pectorale]|uniref:Uncharacterized protein n=1 Tax=Gonium pectorale TaxID=33097 RepID=A0A150H4Q8_GONPE|nr:hypothetical protein GPECTOR_1g94 [Gonium pectorale]|eukprot:KXZ57033.1 hypothetical protein GPECTOR_1g94 [Gonium pectorale]
MVVLARGLSDNATGLALNRSQGYAEVTILYDPYHRKLRDKDDTMKPMKPGLHSHKSNRHWGCGGIFGAAVIGPLLRFRKWLLYAVVTVHYADGQSRWLQVCVISNVALCIGMAVYAPKLAPPLDHFVPPLALQITRSSNALGSLQYFFSIVLFSSFMGTLGYLSMLANYNSPVNQYYRVQCCLSAFFMVLQDLLILLQVVSLLAQWPYLRPSWPYLPMVVFQLINLLAANILQGIIFSKRHDEHNKNLYNAYVAARADRYRVKAGSRPSAAAAKAAGRCEAEVVTDDSRASVEGPEEARPSSSSAAWPRLKTESNADDSSVRRLYSGGPGDVKKHEGMPFHKRPYTYSATAHAAAEKVHAPAGNVSSKARPTLGPKGRTKPLTKKSTTVHGGEEGGLWQRIRGIARRMWHGVRESPDFRYPAWLLAALLVSGYMVIFQYARALEWSGSVKDCILAPSDCATDTLGRYLRFAARLFSRSQQVQLSESLSMLLGTQDEVQDMVASASSANSSAFIQNATAYLVSQLTVRLWQEGLSSRFAWSSVIGFTLGLLLGLSTLVQTAVSFRRAVRQARRLRVARRMFDRLLESSGVAPGGGPAGMLLAGEDSLLANRALKTDVSLVVFFFGVLMSTAVIQLYMVGVLLSVTLAVLTHPWTWTYLVPQYWLYLAAVLAVFVLNKYVLIGYVGSAFLSNGDHIYRPAAWLAFTFIMSITNLVVGLLLAVYRIVLLLLTTVLALGKLEVTIFTLFPILDLPHNSFLAGLHLHVRRAA